MLEELSITLVILKKVCKNFPVAGIKLYTEIAILKKNNIKTKFLKINDLELIAAIKLINIIKNST